MIQRQNRYNSILTQISELKRTIKEFVILQESQKDIYNDKIELEKNKLIITGMKIVIESLKPPTIVNVKRKIIDMMIFALLKSNQNKFVLNKDYCPTKNFLEKVIEKLNKYKERKEISQSEKGKIDTKIKMLKDLIVKDKAIIKFPFTCSIGKLDYIMRYLGFCKGKYSNIVHISKESLKYYYLPFIDKIEPKFRAIFNMFYYDNRTNDEVKNNSTIKIESEEEKENFDSINEKEIEIELNTAINFFVKDKFNSDSIVSDYEKRLQKIDLNRNALIDKYSDSVKDGCQKILDLIEGKDKANTREIQLKLFDIKEKNFIMRELKKFKETLESLMEKLMNLNTMTDDIKKGELINQFFFDFFSIVKNVLDFDEDYYFYLCETEEERYLLVFFQFILMKYQEMNVYSKNFFKIINDYCEKNKKDIISAVFELKNQKGQLFDEIKKIMKIKSAKKLYLERKFTRRVNLKQNFNAFINEIKKYVNQII